MSRPEPIATHRLSNGWEVREFHALRERVFVEPPANGRGSELGRFSVRYNRRHHNKRLSVIHLLGSTDQEQRGALAWALRCAARPHKFPLQGFWARHRDRLYPGNSYYTIVLGDPVDEVAAFERLRRGLHMDDAIDLEFDSLMRQLEQLQTEVNA